MGMIENYNDIITKIYLLSIDDHQNFPLVIVSFSITGIVLKLLRSCLIYNDINSKLSVMDTINQIYVALFYQFYLNWKTKCRTIINFDDAQKELENETFTNWDGMIDQLTRRSDEIKQEQHSQTKALLVSVHTYDDDDVEFGISKNTENAEKI